MIKYQIIASFWASRKGLLILIFSLKSLLSFNQNQNWINYTPDDGLPSSQVYHITQDNNGYLWFATDAGISMYDGYSFNSFNIKDGLPNNVVFFFYHQEDGTIWCTTYSGNLFYFDDKHNFHNYEYNHLIDSVCQNGSYPNEILLYKDKLYLSIVNRIGYYTIDNNGVINCFTSSNNLPTRIVNESVNKNSFVYLQDSSLPVEPIFDESTIASVVVPNVHITEAATIDSITIICDYLNVTLITPNSSIKINTIEAPINVGIYDSSHFWVGYQYGGIAIYNLKGKRVRHYLNGKSGSSIFIDHEGGIWISTLYSGVFYLKKSEVSFHDVLSGDNNINRMTIDDLGNLYIGHYSGMVTKWDKKGSSIIYKPKTSFGFPAFLQYYDSLNSIVIGSGDKLFRYEEMNNKVFQLGGKHISSLSDNPKEPIFIGQRRGFSLLYSSLKYHPIIIRVLDVCLSENGYYICSNTGLFEYKNSQLNKVNKSSLFNIRINDIDELHERYYMASNGNGLIISNKDTVFAINSEDGLYSDLASQVLVENDSTLWVCTKKGLNIIMIKENFEFVVYGVSKVDGLISNEVRDVEVREDKVYIGTAKGLCSIKKSFFEKQAVSRSNFHLSIRKVQVRNKEISLDELCRLNFNENKIVISFQGISFKNRKGLQYRYKLQGLEKQWNYTHSLEAIYPSIIPGNYQFILQAKGRFGKWEDNMISFPIVIHSFYSSWWFILLMLFLFTILIYLFIKYNILSRNRDIVRELLRQLLKRFAKENKYLVFKEQGKEVRVDTSDILYVKSARNYLEVFTTNNKYLLREKISDFTKLVPDPIEFIRVHRSYIVRLDKIDNKDNSSILINGTTIPVGDSYKEELKKIFF